jgi:dipeptidyl aminopeptidase/acylaminoacyl peptidase
VHRAAARNTAGAPSWVTVPPGPGPHPVLLSVYPGRSAWSLQDDVQVAVSAGLAVVQCRPRGADAVLADLDAVLADPALELDADRVGIAGGTLAAALAARTDRFAAAVVEGALPEPGAADTVATPTLVLHAEQDLASPAEHAIAFYTVLRRRGVPTELLLFPGEGHDLPRSGRPRSRSARAEHLLRWWRRWLAVDAEDPHDVAFGDA